MSLESNSSSSSSPFNELPLREKLRLRNHYIHQVRSFLQELGAIEVDTFALCSQTIVDEHIDLMRVESASEKKTYYLLSSPESAMKQLLCKGSGDIFQLSHVYRKGEAGRRHSPAFTMLEWYQVKSDFDTFLQANIQLLSLFVGGQKVRITTYAEAFKNYAGIDSFKDKTALKKALESSKTPYPEVGVKELEQLTWATLVEPKLGTEGFEVITNYPKEDCALAQVALEKGEEVAKRFEIYFHGSELANGYLELKEASIFYSRAKEQNSKRIKAGKEPYPIDEQLKKALKTPGLPSCYGIAIGFDRLLMLATHQSHIQNVLPLPLY